MDSKERNKIQISTNKYLLFKKYANINIYILKYNQLDISTKIMRVKR